MGLEIWTGSRDLGYINSLITFEFMGPDELIEGKHAKKLDSRPSWDKKQTIDY